MEEESRKFVCRNSNIRPTHPSDNPRGAPTSCILGMQQAVTYMNLRRDGYETRATSPMTQMTEPFVWPTFVPPPLASHGSASNSIRRFEDGKRDTKKVSERVGHDQPCTVSDMPLLLPESQSYGASERTDVKALEEHSSDQQRATA